MRALIKSIIHKLIYLGELIAKQWVHEEEDESLWIAHRGAIQFSSGFRPFIETKYFQYPLVLEKYEEFLVKILKEFCQ